MGRIKHFRIRTGSGSKKFSHPDPAGSRSHTLPDPEYNVEYKMVDFVIISSFLLEMKTNN